MISKLNILWITENYPPSKGGMAQSCDRLVRHLRRAGLRIHVLHLGSKGRAYQADEQENGSYSLCTFTGLQPEHEAQLAWLHVEALHHLRPFSQVLAFGGIVPIFLAPLWAAWLGLPLITLLRGNDFDTGIFSPKRRDSLLHALRSSAWVGCVSSDKVDKVRALAPQVPVHYLPNGLDLGDWQLYPSEQQRAKAIRQTLPEDKRILGLFGQLKAKKGLAFLLQALRLSGRAEAFHLLLLGELSEAELLNEPPCGYTHLPFMSRSELIAYYPACDFMAIPSFYDGMPNVLLEAGALGIPILASDTAGMADVLRPAQAGYLFPPADLSACARLLRHLADCPLAELQAQGLKLQAYIRAKHPLEAEIERYLQVFALKT